MGASEIQQAIAREIEDIHVFFADWFTGRGEGGAEALQHGLGRRLAPDFAIILPGGEIMVAEDLLDALAGAHGSNPDFRIAIRNIETRAELGLGMWLVTYEEWQKNAINSTPPDNGRISSAVLAEAHTLGLPFQWLHLHETWLPSGRIAGEPFDF